jgi:2-polyprenyl-3-methyl-5-hydroxy-6-metoxy-1,4-benzoquinol methylase
LEENPGTGTGRPGRGADIGTKPGGEREAVARIIANQRSLIVRLYARIRFLILRQTFLQEIGQYLPRQGRVLDLGCGFGLFSLYFALDAPERRMVGVDLNRDRIEAANECAKKLGVGNVDYTAQNALDWQGHGQFDAIFMLDLIHHLPKEEVEPFLLRVAELLAAGGTLLLKDVSDRPRYKMWFTLLLDRLMVGAEPIHYWPPAELCALVERLGFTVKRHTINDFLPYPHMLYVCTRAGQSRRDQEPDPRERRSPCPRSSTSKRFTATNSPAG